MGMQQAGRSPPPTSAGQNPISRTAGLAGRFLAELGLMCAVMCAGGAILSFAAFAAADWFGYPDLAQQAPELSAVIIAACLALPMAGYMAVRRHPRRHNLEMAGGTIGVGLVLAALLWPGVIATSGPRGWHSLFGLVCGPACLLMFVQMVFSFDMYSGRARRQRAAAYSRRTGSRRSAATGISHLESG